MHSIGLDIETYSEKSLRDSGLYAYALHPSFEILLVTYEIDGGPKILVDLREGEILPEKVVRGIFDPNVKKYAHNAVFERFCFIIHFGKYINAVGWHCTSVKAGILGYPMSLESAAAATGIAAQKDTKGKALIKYFSVPCKPTKVNGGRTRNLPQHNPEKWAQYRAYNKQDVVTESALRDFFGWYPISKFEQELYYIDQKINDYGVLLDLNFIKKVIRIHIEYNRRLLIEAKEITGLQNPNSVKQFSAWLNEELGVAGTHDAVTTLAKEAVQNLLDNDRLLTPKARRALEVRQELAITSIKKYYKMLQCVCPDGRVRGMLQFYGATKTGRWAGRLVQLQNLKKNDSKYLELMRRLVRVDVSESIDLLTMLCGSVPAALSELVRTAFIAGSGKTFGVADFASIEARVLAWLCDQHWKMEAFAQGKDIYTVTASGMFHIPESEISKDSKERARGKIAELSLGYAGGVGALLRQAAVAKMYKKGEITMQDLESMVHSWRTLNKEIKRYWYQVKDAAVSAIDGTPVSLRHGLQFKMIGKNLMIKLPSGRHLVYNNARLIPGKYGPEIVFHGTDDKGIYGLIRTHGGKLVENITQAIARDCLAIAMTEVNYEGFKIVMHVHDELVTELPKTTAKRDLKYILDIMAEPISWAPGLNLKAAGYLTPFYKKD